MAVSIEQQNELDDLLTQIEKWKVRNKKQLSGSTQYVMTQGLNLLWFVANQIDTTKTTPLPQSGDAE